MKEERKHEGIVDIYLKNKNNEREGKTRAEI